MSMERRNDVVVGAFVLLGVAVIVLGGIWLSEARIGGDARRLTAIVPNAGQLSTGNPVTLRGVKVGEVEQIDFGSSGQVLLTLRVERTVPLPERPAVLLRPTSLFGQWEAALVPSSRYPDARLDSAARAAGHLPGVTQAEFSDISSYTEDIAQNLQRITDQLESVLSDTTVQDLAAAARNFERASGELAGMLREQRKSFGAVAEDVSEAGRAARRAAVALDSTFARLEGATGEGELEAMVDDARATTSELRQLASELRENSRRMDRVLARADTTLGGADRFFTRLNRGEGSLGRLVADTAFYEETVATLIELRAFLDDLKGNPGKYFNFSIF